MWEYKLIDSSDIPDLGGPSGEKRSRKDLEAYLNQLGAEGWEIIAFDVDEQLVKPNFAGLARRPKAG